MRLRGGIVDRLVDSSGESSAPGRTFLSQPDLEEVPDRQGSGGRSASANRPPIAINLRAPGLPLLACRGRDLFDLVGSLTQPPGHGVPEALVGRQVQGLLGPRESVTVARQSRPKASTVAAVASPTRARQPQIRGAGGDSLGVHSVHGAHPGWAGPWSGFRAGYVDFRGPGNPPLTNCTRVHYAAFVPGP